jgi:hypothetical protein
LLEDNHPWQPVLTVGQQDGAAGPNAINGREQFVHGRDMDRGDGAGGLLGKIQSVSSAAQFVAHPGWPRAVCP